MLLNCDLGESYGAWKMPVDSAIMALIDQANIACGFHAGDPVALKHAIALAARHRVMIGAHPSYPDLQGFGRRSMAMPHDELVACLEYQISALSGLASLYQQSLSYVKPHGALYNDMMQSENVRDAVFQAVSGIGGGTLKIMVQAHPAYQSITDHAKTYDLAVIFEAFADRHYEADGYLMSRHKAGAVLDEAGAVRQAEQIIHDSRIVACDGTVLTMPIDTLCVHGDTQGAVQMASAIRRLIDENGTQQ
ncbi:5-oxoprolinase subunit PxpA [Salinimonas sp. HHU 13199]|uniref:5-oxoprolinase subunit PxpA n=1 Tax=Salinimonas profundi TaxID=2729140 RepID=A0ABR8LL92_9ALTE|nr:5-oxoprolinase subunit PxpA [Salinimonas profundi]MBD3584709.1 5-oxoprolinase subunit PxpA [Salinimonas profundi]